MNALFNIIFLISTAILLFLSPESFLASLLDGGSKAATLCLSLVATYSVWLGLMKVWEACGVSRGISKLLRPLAKILFKTEDKETLDAVCMNLSVNFLGISGAATPYGIQAARLLDKSEHAEYASSMFFVLNATSLQLIPTSIIGIRVALHSASPADVILPTLFCSVLTTLLGGVLVRLLIPPKRASALTQKGKLYGNIQKTRGAGI